MAIVVAAVLALLGAVHIYWAMGSMRLGGAAVPQIGGKPAFTPTRAATLLVAAALSVAAVLVLARGGVVAVPVPWWAIYWASWLLAAIFIGRSIGDFRLVGFFKRVRDSRFATYDTYAYSPLCLALGAAMLWLASR